MSHILTIDQGTTGTTVLVISRQLDILSKVNTEFPQIYPKPGWVEHDPQTIWESVTSSISQALVKAGISGEQITGVGITNQRETTVVWNRHNGEPIHNAIVWQCRRTGPICQSLRDRGLNELFRGKTGLVLDPYFSGTKLSWLLDHVPGASTSARAGELAFGTIDSWLIWKLSGGASHVTDVTNASRTLLFNIHTREWDDELLEILDVPRSLLPTVVPCAGVAAHTRGIPGLPDGIPIAGIAGDQQAALFGQTCFSPGEAKITYGTGAFLLMNTGDEAISSHHGLLTTIAWQLGDTVTYALEGSVFIAGAAIQWLRDGLQLITDAAECEALALSVESSDGVVFVPALTGLGAPHWAEHARGAIFGLSRGTTRAHIVRAALEGVAFSCYELLHSMSEDLGQTMGAIRVDGGMAANAFLLQTQSDLLQVPIVCPSVLETTALGAALLAGLGVGIWRSLDELRSSWREDRRFEPQCDKAQTRAAIEEWRQCINRVI